MASARHCWRPSGSGSHHQPLTSRRHGGLAPPALTVLRIPLRGTRLWRAIDPGDLCQPSGPDGEGQAKAQVPKLAEFLETPDIARSVAHLLQRPPRTSLAPVRDRRQVSLSTFMLEPRSARSPRCAHIGDRPRLGTTPGQSRGEGGFRERT